MIITLISYNARKVDLGNGLFLFQSKLGWTIGGNVVTNTDEVTEANLFVGTTMYH